MSEVEITSNGLIYGGWKSATITRSIETLCGAFSLSVSDTWDEASSWTLREGDPAEIKIDGQIVITGFIDKRAVSISATSHSVTIEGRDAAADLVDTPVRLTAWEYLKVKPSQILDAVAEYFQISVLPAEGVTLPDSTIDKFSINPGETGFAVIDRFARLFGVLPVSDGKGAIRLIRPGVTRAPVSLEEGRNIKEAKASYDQKSRFYSYTVLGQQRGSEKVRKNANQVEGVAFDLNMSRRNRTMILQSENAITPEQATARAQWESDVRAARAERVSVTVQGWTEGGYLWTPGELVPVRAKTLGINGDMVIASVSASKGTNRGEETELELTRPDAYKAAPEEDRAWKE